MFTTYFCCLFFSLISILFYLTTKRYRYWKVKKVPHLKPALLFGNFKDFLYLKRDVCEIEQQICRQFPQEPYVGVYYGTEPTLVVQDPDLISLITNKEFNAFNGREISRYCHHEVFTNSVIYTFGERWKVTKQACSPLFTLLRLKNMFYMIEKSTSDLEKMLAEEVSVAPIINVRDAMAKYTLDCIASCFLGINADIMNKTSENNPFKVMGEKVFEVSEKRKFLYTIRSMWPSVFYGLGLKAFPVEIDSFFLNLYKDVCKSRGYKPCGRNDIIDHFLADGNHGDDLVIGVIISLFAAGFETSATSLSHTLYELAKHKESQDKAIEEVDEYLLKTGGKITYVCVNDLPYLNACNNEALRLYPAQRVVHREVMEDFTLPTGLKLEKGIRIHIPAYHIHRRPDFFPEPDQFRPERFLNDSIKPFTYIPFGEGRRLCVGKRFAKMMMLPCLVTILKKYRVSVAESMPPLQHEVGSILVTPKGPILLKFTPREEIA